MAGQSPALSLDAISFSETLLEHRSLKARARAIAQCFAAISQDCAATVYLIAQPDGEDVWIPKASSGDIQVTETAIAWNNMLGLGLLAEQRAPIFLSALDLRRELYSHLQIRRTFSALTYLPLIREEKLLGTIEIVSFDSDLDELSLSSYGPLVRLAASALLAAIDYEEEQGSSLASITRLTQLYDLEKSFSSTLEMDELLPIIGSKFREVLDCLAINIWLVQPDGSLILSHQSGVDSTTSQGQVQRPGEGVAGDVSDSGESVLIDSPDDERLQRRNRSTQDQTLTSLMAVPLLDDASLVGVVEAIDRNDGKPFNEDDLFALTSISETAVGALHNASLFQAERKLEILETLVRVSTEITATLDLDRVLQAVVNGPASVIPYERAAIALQQRGRFQLRAISGQPEFDNRDPQMKRLEELLQWTTLAEEPLLVRRRDGNIESPDDREEARVKFANFFDDTAMSGFYAIPLLDEEGTVGVLSFESSDPDFLSDAHLEMLKVLASQATVALRNASLYREVPFINVLEPLIKRKKKFQALDAHRRTAMVALAIAVVVFLFVVPLPYRVEGDALVAPIRSANIQPQIEGVIQQVLVREGDRVSRGDLIAQMQDGEFRAALAAAQAKLDAAMGAMNRSLSNGDGTEAGIQRNEANFWSAEVARAKERLEAARIRSPIDGVVATAHIEDFVGKRLQFGDPFAEVINSAETSVDVAVDEEDVGLLRDAQRAWIKLDAFPNRTFQGDVAVVSPKAEIQATGRVFFARVLVPNPAGLLRSGMQGRGKVMTGWRPAGVVIFRHPAIAVWTRLWSAFGW